MKILNDISVTAYIYDINIAIYLKNEDDNLGYIHMFSYEEQNYIKPLLILFNEDFNHFNIVYDIEEFEANDIITHETDQKKNEIDIAENKQIYISRKQWEETNKSKAPAMSYFEAMAKEFVKEDSSKLAELSSRLFRFKKAYESIESKQNALKKKMEAIRYEI